MEFQVTKAKRRAVPALISLSGTSGSGKTLSGLILAGGLAGPTGKVGMVDAENGRGTLYADNRLVNAAIPNGYEYVEITAPFTPGRYIMALEALEAAGCTVAVIDSTSHEWEGEGGCCDIAETKKLRGMPNWALAKRDHKKFLAYCLSSKMHIIFCLRAREKVKITDDSKVIPQGIQPIAEKNFVFEMLLSLMFDEKTHAYSGIKVPEMLLKAFPDGRLITVEHGVAVREWCDGGQALDPADLLRKRAAAAALGGLQAYGEFFASLPVADKKALQATTHERNKEIAKEVDEEAKREEILSAEADAPPSEGGAA
jgi:hypothetical protein